ncbi:hypothetical protein FQN54_000511 [Arachnomyces sp. PD_36]|nr:hypothetical protein FQN54_000511 [Arachnomyces sp. PD_36]
MDTVPTQSKQPTTEDNPSTQQQQQSPGVSINRLAPISNPLIATLPSQRHLPVPELPPPTSSHLPSHSSIIMRQPPATLPGASATVTYTPTTHRVSKAKKGKRVHACEFPGCNKIFTRAEHRRRHQLNHSPEASFPCKISGCRKAFHRPDLLARHMERHELDAQAEEAHQTHARQSSYTPAYSDTSRQITPATSLESRSNSISAATSQQSGSLQVDASAPINFGNEYSMPMWSGFEGTLNSRNMFPELARATMDDGPLYSSPDSCRSPCSDESSYQLPYRRQTTSSVPTSTMEQFPATCYNVPLTSSPLAMATTLPEWSNQEASVPTSQIMPISLEGDSILQPVGEPSLWVSASMDRSGTNTQPEPPVPIPLSNLDGDEWFALRRELTSAPGVVSGDDGMEIMDTVKWQECFECYWQHFHPLFPIVHRPSFFATKPSPLLAGAMVAIGSQYDSRPNAKEYSLALLEACVKLLAKRTPITSRSRVTDIQTVFLLEILFKFRSRRADIRISHRFRSLYGSFIHDRHWVSLDPLAVYNTLGSDPKADDLKRAHKFWVEHESRRRVLQAAFILDIQQSILFEQPLALLQKGLSNRNGNGSWAIELPFPCPSALWESGTIEEWNHWASLARPLTLSSVAEGSLKSVGDTTCDIGAFQATLVLSHLFLTRMNSPDLEPTLRKFVDALDKVADNQRYTSLKYSQTLFTYHALLASKNTPLLSLLTVSGESWLFNRKLPQQSEFRAAKEKLRAWASDTEAARKAVWHAVRVLEFAFNYPETTTGSSLESYLQGPTTKAANPLSMLHTNWALYTSALICWAYGFDSTSPPTPTQQSHAHLAAQQQLQPQSALSYIKMLIFLSPTWEGVSHATIPRHIRRCTGPLLEFVRQTRLGQGKMGGLLSEGERVLARLCGTGTGKGEMWEF